MPYTQWFTRTKKTNLLGLVLHRRCRDRPVIQHVPNWKSNVLPSFLKLTTGFLFQEPSSRLYKLSRYCVYTPTLRGPDPQFTCNSKLCKSISFNNHSTWDLLTAPLMFPQKAQEMWRGRASKGSVIDLRMSDANDVLTTQELWVPSVKHLHLLLANSNSQLVFAVKGNFAARCSWKIQ